MLFRSSGGNVGADAIAKSAPDGYTIGLMSVSSHAIATTLYTKLPFDFLRDWAPVAGIIRVPKVMEVTNSLPAKTVAEFIAHAKANPGKLNFANAGTGATSQLCELLLKTTTGSQWTSVPYKGTGPALNDLLGEQVDLTCDQPASTLGHIKGGNLKPIAVATKQRLGVLPDVPTFGESGVPGFELAVWHGLYAPRGTPKPVVDKLAAALRQALIDPTFVQRCNEMNALIVPAERGTPDALKTRLTKDVERWKTTLKAVGIQPE